MKVRELLSGPEKWTTGAVARNWGGSFEGAHSALAVRWCLVGALRRCYGDDEEPVRRARRHIRAEGNYGSVTAWNDAPGRTFEEVRALVEELDI